MPDNTAPAMQMPSAQGADNALAKSFASLQDEKPLAAPSYPKLPTLPDHPIVDEHQWQQVGTALVAFAMLAGATKGNWLGAGTALAGAMQGYRNGDEEVARQQYSDFQAKYREAMDRERQINQQYADALHNRQLSMNAKIAAMRVIAAQYQHQAMLAATEERNFMAMQKLMVAREVAIAKIDQLHGQATSSLDPYGALSAGDKSAVDEVAAMVVTGAASGQQLLYRLGSKNPLIPAIFERINEMQAKPDQFKGILDRATKIVASRASGHALETSESQQATVMQAVNTALHHLTTLNDLAQKVGNEGPIAWNAFVNKGERQFNNKDVTDFIAANELLVNEVAKALNPAGKVTVQGQREIEHIITTNYSAGNYGSVTNIIRKMLEQRADAIQQTNQAIRQQVPTGGVGSLLPQGQTPPQADLPTFHIVNGKLVQQ